MHNEIQSPRMYAPRVKSLMLSVAVCMENHCPQFAWGAGLHSYPVSAGGPLLCHGKQTPVCECSESKSGSTAALCLREAWSWATGNRLPGAHAQSQSYIAQPPCVYRRPTHEEHVYQVL